jgi:tetratricopeptide (TPR) repeat protein
MLKTIPKPARTVLLISEILATSFLIGFAVPAMAQSPSAPNPQTPPGYAPRRFDVLEEIENLQQSTVGFNGFRAEYKTAGEASTLSGAEPVFRATPAPPTVISAQTLRHHPPKAARKAFEQGVASQRKGRQTEAIEHFATAVSLDPLYVEARAELGVLYVLTGEVSKALEQFERASELEPNSSMLHFNRAWTLMSLGRASEAEREARRVLALNPQDADAHSLIDSALVAQGRSPKGTH